jgi:hypothetical protein
MMVARKEVGGVPEKNIPEGFVGVEGAADRIGVSRTKIWRLIREDRLTTRSDVLDRRRRLIAVEELDRLVASRVEQLNARDQE